MGGLLFLALAYFAVGQATVSRSGAQTAADAAALAAAQDARKQLADEWTANVLDPTKWQDIFSGNVPFADLPCRWAPQLADQNDAHVVHCAPSGLLAYTVRVEANKPIGDSVVPITSTKHSKASATAVIKPLCWFKPLGPGAGTDVLPRLNCKHRYWDLEPKHLTDLPKPQDLFDVHLADR